MTLSRARNALRALVFVLIGAFAVALPSMAATLLPNGEQQFFDANGTPLAGGFVYFYIPGSTTPKDTWQDTGQTIRNANPVTLDGAGRAIIYGSGAYRQRVTDASGNLIWDQVTSDTSVSQNSWAGTSAGTANAITVSAAAFSFGDGQTISFRAGSTNTTAATLLVNGNSGLAVVRDLPGGLGTTPLVGGEISAGDIVTVVYDVSLGAFHLQGVPASTGQLASLVASSTVNLGTVQSQVVSITGSGATITSFGTYGVGYSPAVTVSFTGTNTITYNATSLITPTGASITTSAGDSAVIVYLGSGNWQIVSYIPGFSQALPPLSASGLVVTNDNSVPNTSIDVNFTSAVLGASGKSLSVGANSLVINTTINGANGLDTGTLAGSSWYYEYIISNGSTVAGLASLSATAPALPSGYTFFMRVGAMRTDSTPKFYRTLQKGRDAQYVVTATTNTAAMPTLATTNIAIGYTSASMSAFAPPTATKYKISVWTGGAAIGLAPNANYGVVSTSTNPPPVVTSSGQLAEMVAESTSVYWATSGAGQLYVFGWADSVNAI